MLFIAHSRRSREKTLSAFDKMCCRNEVFWVTKLETLTPTVDSACLKDILTNTNFVEGGECSSRHDSVRIDMAFYQICFAAQATVFVTDCPALLATSSMTCSELVITPPPCAKANASHPKFLNYSRLCIVRV